jgi:hypothetical protein
MERIEALIRKLTEQYEKQADPNVMLGTVQLLQFELSKLRTGAFQQLGTSKVAVVLPAAQSIPQEYEQYAPRVSRVEEAAVAEVKEKENRETREVKETVLVEDGAVSVVQKNGQLDMVFDPMKEIPTLSHQSTSSRRQPSPGAEEESINDRLRETKTELVEVLKETPVRDLRKAIGINDKFLFINDLFRGDETMYERSIRTINNFNIYAEAEYWITRELQVKLGWPDDHPSVHHFNQLVKRRFS